MSGHKITLIAILATIFYALNIQGVPTEENVWKKWEVFKTTYHKQYKNPSEEAFRKELFLKKLKHVEEHNEKFKQGLISFEIGINKFSDYTEEEKQIMHKKFFLNKSKSKPNVSFVSQINDDLPESIDWRDKGVITPVKDQGMKCQSDWAGSVVDAIESQYRIQKNQQVFLSIQQLVDCAVDKNGCWGGWMDWAYQYIINNTGINTSEDYPYEATDTEGCRQKPEKPRYGISSFVNIERGSELDLMIALANVGPVAVALDTTGDFDSYKSGIYHNPNCDQNNVDHAMLAVGYGRENEQDYWLLKNSYSEDWGDKGYIKIARFENDLCGVATFASYPVL